MAKLKLRGVITDVSPMEYVGEKKETKMQKFVLEVAARRNEFDEVIGANQQWQITAFNDKIDKYLKTIGSGVKLEVDFYVESYEVEKKDTPGEFFYSSNNVLFELKTL